MTFDIIDIIGIDFDNYLRYSYSRVCLSLLMSEVSNFLFTWMSFTFTLVHRAMVSEIVHHNTSLSSQAMYTTEISKYPKSSFLKHLDLVQRFHTSALIVLT